MIKRLSALFFGLLAVGLLAILIGFGLLHTQYAKPIILQNLNQLSQVHFDSEDVDYQYPNKLTFSNIVAQFPDDSETQATELTLWFGLPHSFTKPLRVKELLLSGANLQSMTWSHYDFKWWQVDNIALKHIDYSNHDFVINDLQLQMQQIDFDDSFVPQKTDFQLQASQFYYQGESLTNLLINGRYQPNNSVIYGASFEWNEAKISTQAQQENNTWSLVNATVEKLDYHFDSVWLEKIATLKQTIGHINSLDILNSNLSSQDGKVINLNASLENIDLRRSLLDQDNAYISLDSDSFFWQEFQFIEPTLQVSIDNGEIQLDDLDTNLEQGRIQASGHLSKQNIALKHFRLDGIKFVQEQQQPSLTALINPAWFKDIKSISIDNVEITRGQWIQLNQQPHWQLTGVNIDSENLILKRDYRWGMWQGKLLASVNSASYDKIISNQLVLETESNNGLWRLNRLIIPLQEGFATAQASLNFAAPSQPLLVEAQALSLPVSLANYLLVNPERDLYFDGKMDLELNLDALIADPLAFSRTATGKLRAQFHQAQITAAKEEPQAVDITPLILSLDRGQVELDSVVIEGNKLKGQAGGTTSLIEPSASELTLDITVECGQSYRIELLSGLVHTSQHEPCQNDAGN
ncbi:AsmA family protein [Vibrio hippocampi]|uniref:AsmA domain-containing protein n=1 Tax=Vibrio hippocampi TaxID=654686 RepID=A0ABN8DC23_9VIBR|nr:AsmA family protein [Vibrio hippocampi]CAH0524363.1 hypothetical protein VHP8226_00190 [Vibrio hippocampi]